jgi:succinoglycan biosynthesis protein ExoM
MKDARSITTMAVAICTYNRNEPLAVLLRALLVNARRVKGNANIGVVVVDDSSDGRARSVIDGFEDQFDLGVFYYLSGKQNISIARNLAIEAASSIADWIVMIDDDCEPVPEWLETLLEVQARTQADAVTGPMVRRVPLGSPAWILQQPFLQLGLEALPDCSEVSIASTFNSMIASRWIKENPSIRFQPSLGVVGGEDMVFYRAARAKGLRIVYAQQASVYENEPLERATLAYQLRLFFWHGNSAYIASVRSGVSPFRMFLHGANSLRKALLRPIVRVSRGESAEWRYCLALILHAAGKIIGPFGVQVRHK